MEQSLMDQLTAIVGKENVEESKGNVVVYPKNTDQVSGLLKLAANTNTQIAIREKPNHVLNEEKTEKLVLDLSKLNSLIEIDKDNVTANVQTGMTLNTLQWQLLEQGFYFPPVSIWDYDSFVITALAKNNIGLNSARYGRWREFVIGMEVVLYSGEKIVLGGKVIKYVSGLDLMSLFIGSKNQLGIVTRVIIRLLPKPEARKMLICGFDSLSDAIGAVQSLSARRIDPARNEVITPGLAAKIGLPGINPDQAAVLTELEGFANSLDRQKAEIEVAYKKFRVKSLVVIDQEHESNLIWQKYFGAADLYKGQTFYNINVLPSKLESMAQFLENKTKDMGLEFETIIHSGLVNIDLFVEGDRNKLEAFAQDLLKTVRMLGGKTAHEKIGIGSHIKTIDRLEHGLRELFAPKQLLLSKEGGLV